MELVVTSLDRMQVSLSAGFRHKLAIGEANCTQRSEQEVQPQTTN